MPDDYESFSGSDLYEPEYAPTEEPVDSFSQSSQQEPMFSDGGLGAMPSGVDHLYSKQDAVLQTLWKQQQKALLQRDQALREGHKNPTYYVDGQLTKQAPRPEDYGWVYPLGGASYPAADVNFNPIETGKAKFYEDQAALLQAQQDKIRSQLPRNERGQPLFSDRELYTNSNSIYQKILDNAGGNLSPESYIHNAYWDSMRDAGASEDLIAATQRSLLPVVRGMEKQRLKMKSYNDGVKEISQNPYALEYWTQMTSGKRDDPNFAGSATSYSILRSAKEIGELMDSNPEYQSIFDGLKNRIKDYNERFKADPDGGEKLLMNPDVQDDLKTLQAAQFSKSAAQLNSVLGNYIKRQVAFKEKAEAVDKDIQQQFINLPGDTKDVVIAKLQDMNAKGDFRHNPSYLTMLSAQIRKNDVIKFQDGTEMPGLRKAYAEQDLDHKLADIRDPENYFVGPDLKLHKLTEVNNDSYREFRELHGDTKLTSIHPGKYVELNEDIFQDVDGSPVYLTAKGNKDMATATIKIGSRYFYLRSALEALGIKNEDLKEAVGNGESLAVGKGKEDYFAKDVPEYRVPMLSAEQYQNAKPGERLSFDAVFDEYAKSRHLLKQASNPVWYAPQPDDPSLVGEIAKAAGRGMVKFAGELGLGIPAMVKGYADLIYGAVIQWKYGDYNEAEEIYSGALGERPDTFSAPGLTGQLEGLFEHGMPLTGGLGQSEEATTAQRFASAAMEGAVDLAGTLYLIGSMKGANNTQIANAAGKIRGIMGRFNALKTEAQLAEDAAGFLGKGPEIVKTLNRQKLGMEMLHQTADLLAVHALRGGFVSEYHGGSFGQGLADAALQNIKEGGKTAVMGLTNPLVQRVGAPLFGKNILTKVVEDEGTYSVKKLLEKGDWGDVAKRFGASAFAALGMAGYDTIEQSLEGKTSAEIKDMLTSPEYLSGVVFQLGLGMVGGANRFDEKMLPAREKGPMIGAEGHEALGLIQAFRKARVKTNYRHPDLVAKTEAVYRSNIIEHEREEAKKAIPMSEDEVLGIKQEFYELSAKEGRSHAEQERLDKLSDIIHGQDFGGWTVDSLIKRFAFLSRLRAEYLSRGEEMPTSLEAEWHSIDRRLENGNIGENIPFSNVREAQAARWKVLKEKLPDLYEERRKDVKEKVRQLWEEINARRAKRHAIVTSNVISARTPVTKDPAKAAAARVPAFGEQTDLKPPVPIPPTPDNLPNVSNVHTKRWYHGSGSKKLTPENIDTSSHGNVESLFGLGFYMSDDPPTAGSYVLGKNKGVGALYRIFVQNIRGILNFEKSLPEKAILSIEKDLPKNLKEVVRKAANENNATGVSVWKALTEAIREESHQEQIPISEYIEFFQQIQSNLRESGYDAITHIGGIHAGKNKKLHRVLIILDPNNEGGYVGQDLPRTIKSMEEIPIEKNPIGRSADLKPPTPPGQPAQPPAPPKTLAPLTKPKPDFSKIPEALRPLAEAYHNAKEDHAAGKITADQLEAARQAFLKASDDLLATDKPEGSDKPDEPNPISDISTLKKVIEDFIGKSAEEVLADTQLVNQAMEASAKIRASLKAEIAKLEIAKKAAKAAKDKKGVESIENQIDALNKIYVDNEANVLLIGMKEKDPTKLKSVLDAMKESLAETLGKKFNRKGKKSKAGFTGLLEINKISESKKSPGLWSIQIQGPEGAFGEYSSRVFKVRATSKENALEKGAEILQAEQKALDEKKTIAITPGSSQTAGAADVAARNEIEDRRQRAIKSAADNLGDNPSARKIKESTDYLESRMLEGQKLFDANEVGGIMESILNTKKTEAGKTRESLKRDGEAC